MSRRVRVFVATVAPLLLALGCAATDPETTPNPPAPTGSTMTFDAEFDGNAGAAPDSHHWLHDVGGTGWGNKEQEYYTDGTSNTALDGQGHLAITARQGGDGNSCWYGACTYTSGKITTRRQKGVNFAQTYGRFEARIKAPIGKGIWPAFWLVGKNLESAGTDKAGEIDVMEILGDKPDQVQQHAHGPGMDYGEHFNLPPGSSVADWHTYAVDWTPSRVDWLVDGHVTQTMTKDQAGDGWVFDHPFYVLLNLAVGGDFPGNADKSTKFPATMLVDYVRVYKTPQDNDS